jgi:hypothetical protein
MDRAIASIIVLSLCVLLSAKARGEAQSALARNGSGDAVVINMRSVNVNERHLLLRYEIRNNSAEDIWVCTTIDNEYGDAEVYAQEDNQVLLVRRRLDVPTHAFFYGPPDGRYVRLHPRQSRTESVLLPIPVHCHTLFADTAPTAGVVFATKIMLEIGYYAGDLPRMIRETLEGAEKTATKGTPKSADVRSYLGSVSAFFNLRNRGLRARDEVIVVPYSFQTFPGEKVVRSVVTDQRTPYTGQEESGPLTPPDLGACTRVEARFQPSMLEFFFPYASEQSLFSAAEREHLRSLKELIIENPQDIKALASDIGQEHIARGTTTWNESMAQVACYRDGQRITSFTLYDDKTIEMDEKDRLNYARGLNRLRMLTPQIKAFDMRVQCGACLKNLWWFFRLYAQAGASEKTGWFKRRATPYPRPDEWCDAFMPVYGVNEKVFMCPSAAKGKCDYAMNRNCVYDSPADTVLLFETKPGWNQHGGPELFTFDNHDPRGGLVLLNDGTVKFIRTEDELKQLRWK